MKIYNPNREERAFLYQEAQDLEGIVKNLGSLSVMVEERADDFAVTFMVAPETFGMRVRAIDDNLFDATIAAKKEALRQLNALLNSMPRPAPDQIPGGVPAEHLH